MNLSSTRTGDVLPDRTQTISAVTMAAYAGATWDWFQIHLDTDAARAAGFTTAVVDGQLLGALLAAHAQDGIGPGARVVAMEFRHAAAVYRGETIRLTGSCVESDPSGTVTVQQDVWVVDPTTQAQQRLAVRAARTTLQAPPNTTTEG